MRVLVAVLFLALFCSGEELPDAPMPQPSPVLHTFNHHLDYVPSYSRPHGSHFIKAIIFEFNKYDVQYSPLSFDFYFTKRFFVGFTEHYACGFLPPGPKCK